MWAAVKPKVCLKNPADQEDGGGLYRRGGSGRLRGDVYRGEGPGRYRGTSIGVRDQEGTG